MKDDQSDALNFLAEQLPGPPKMGLITTTNLWIIEWLLAQDRRTGKLLHDWIEERRSGWAAYSPCSSKAEVLAALEQVIQRAQRTNIVPILHLEAHGGEDGLVGPNGAGGIERLRWDELTEFLQKLNLATRCNLLVFVGACTGFAGIKAFNRGPRAPAVALVGPSSSVEEANLIWATKEFCRRYMDPSPNLTDITASASREAGATNFELEPFAMLAFESMIQLLIHDLHPGEWAQRIEKNRGKGPALQSLWDQLFMIDLWPENRQRFGVDMAAVVDALSKIPESMVLAASGYRLASA